MSGPILPVILQLTDVKPTFLRDWSHDSVLELLREAASGERLVKQQADEC